MKDVREMTDEELRETALDLIARELGPAALIRFLQLYSRGHGDYTAERHQWLDRLQIDDIAEQIQKNRK